MPHRIRSVGSLIGRSLVVSCLSLVVSQCLAKPRPPAPAEPAPVLAQPATESPQETLHRFNAFLDRA
ncbi:MAG: hypothetical protein J4F42_13515 [Desulfurellaceae bacterium]|nr:hypothetical protein [Desulfurellaceae bacterium]